MELLKKLYEIHSMSGREKKLKRFVRKWIAENVPTAKMSNDSSGNIYVVKGESETYPVVVAHLDQVQNDHSRDFQALQAGDIILGYSAKSRAQQGLGADDKNGIWVALKCLEKYDNIKIALFVSEEVGCVGSGGADMGFFSDARFVLQCDRRGAHDLITECGWTKICGSDFVEAIYPSKFGYKEATGLMTDVLMLKERGLDVSAVNISCGYYQPHTDEEITVIPDLMNCLAFVEYIIENCTDVYHHEYNYYAAAAYYGKNSYLYNDDDDDFMNGNTWVNSDDDGTEGEIVDENDYDLIAEIYDNIVEFLCQYPSCSKDGVAWYLERKYPDKVIKDSTLTTLYDLAKYYIHEQGMGTAGDA